MKSKIGLLVLVVSVLILLGALSAFAANAYLDVGPLRIPPDGTGAICFKNRFETSRAR